VPTYLFFSGKPQAKLANLGSMARNEKITIRGGVETSDEKAREQTSSIPSFAGLFPTWLIVHSIRV
jgi:hypothetical protein